MVTYDVMLKGRQEGCLEEREQGQDGPDLPQGVHLLQARGQGHRVVTI